jgi:hypothetical protein
MRGGLNRRCSGLAPLAAELHIVRPPVNGDYTAAWESYRRLRRRFLCVWLVGPLSVFALGVVAYLVAKTLFFFWIGGMVLMITFLVAGLDLSAFPCPGMERPCFQPSGLSTINSGRPAVDAAFRSTRMSRPNKRLQRTRSAPPRAPLSRKSLGRTGQASVRRELGPEWLYRSRSLPAAACLRGHS